MEMPSHEFIAPHRPLMDVRDAHGSSDVLAVMGSARNIGELVGLTGLRSLWISGVTRSVASVVGELHWIRSLVVHDWRCRDLTALSGLHSLRSMSIVGSGALSSLLGVGCLLELQSLMLLDNSKITDIADLAPLRKLETLVLEGGLRRGQEMKIEGLQPLRGMACMRRLRIEGVRVNDTSLTALSDMASLETLHISSEFPRSEVERLARCVPAAGHYLARLDAARRSV